MVALATSRPSRRRFDDSCNPPAVGPLAAAEWSPAACRWTVRLTPDGIDLVVNFLTVRPGRPLRQLRRQWPGVYAAAVAAGLSEDDIAEACEAAVLRAAETFDPAKGVKFATYLKPWLRGRVLDAIRRWAKHRRHGVRVVSGTADRGGDLPPLFDGVADNRAGGDDGHGSRAGAADAVRAAVAEALPDPRARYAVVALFGLGGGGERSPREVARALRCRLDGVSAMVRPALVAIGRRLLTAGTV